MPFKCKITEKSIILIQGKEKKILRRTVENAQLIDALIVSGNLPLKNIEFESK